MNNKLIVAFHIGRGGRFHNQGHKTFNGRVKTLSDCYDNNAFICNEDINFNTLPDEEWTLQDCAGNIKLSGRAAIESPVGVLDWDGEYDTDIVKYIEDCDDNEMEILYDAFLDDDVWMSEPVKEYVCNFKGLKRIKDVDFSLNIEATIHFTDGSEMVFEWDESHDVTEEEMREWMTDKNIDPVSIEKYAEKFEDYFQTEI